MRLLLTNDDGVRARGLEALAAALRGAHDIVIAAPQEEQSGASHRLTLDRPLRAIPKREDGPGWAIPGTPADCVKLALHNLVEGPIDAVISGINRGSNQGVLAHYSGTVAAAKEAALAGLPAIAISLCSYRGRHFDDAAALAADLIPRLLAAPWSERSMVNINIPDKPRSEIAGLKVAPMSRRLIREGYEERKDPRGLPYYWLKAGVDFHGEAAEDDLSVVAEGYVALSPLTLDWTDRAMMDGLAQLEEERWS